MVRLVILSMTFLKTLVLVLMIYQKCLLIIKSIKVKLFQVLKLKIVTVYKKFKKDIILLLLCETMYKTYSKQSLYMRKALRHYLCKKHKPVLFSQMEILLKLLMLYKLQINQELLLCQMLTKVKKVLRKSLLKKIILICKYIDKLIK